LDLTPARFEPEHELDGLPPELAALIAGVGARQAASATARVQAAIRGSAAAPRDPFPAAHGAFNAGVADVLSRWKGR